MPNYLTELSPDNNTHVYQIKDKEAAPIDLLKDTVGWVGKNLLNIKDGTATQPTQVYYENDTIKVVGGTWANFNTPTTKFSKAESLVFSVNVAVTSGTLNYAIVKNGSNVAEDNFTESTSKIVSLQVSANDEILVRFRSPNNGVGVFSNIMLRDASILDDTYEPYHESVEQCKFDRAEQRVLGAKNILPYPYKDSTKTANGLTFTDNGDGTITINGTATANTTFSLDTKGTSQAGFLRKFAGKPIKICGGHSENKRIEIWATNIGYPINYASKGEAVVVTLPSVIATDSYNIRILIQSGEICNNEIFYPQFLLASDPDSTYQPYAMTNRELTEIAQPSNGILQVGKLVVINKLFTTNASLSGGGWNSNRTDFVFPKPINNVPIRVFISGTGFADMMLGTNGNNVFSQVAVDSDKNIYITCAYIAQ